MSKTKISLIILVVAMVGAAYFYVYRDWFRSPTIQVYHRVSNRPPWQRRKNAPPANSLFVVFGLDRKASLTRIKVQRVDQLSTNSDALPVWHLVSQSNSVPLKGFFYGQPIGGMQPYVKGTRPSTLESNVNYRIFIEAGSKKGQHDFSIGGTNEDTNPPG